MNGRIAAGLRLHVRRSRSGAARKEKETDQGTRKKPPDGHGGETGVIWNDWEVSETSAEKQGSEAGPGKTPP